MTRAIRETYRSRHAPEVLLKAYADGVPAFAAALPAVRAVVELDRRDAHGVQHRVHRWHADVSRFPSVLTGLLGPEAFIWTTHCAWTPTELRGVWWLEIGVFGEGEHLRGQHRFFPTEGGTRTEVEGEVLVTASAFDQLAGIPLAGPLAGLIDRLITRVFREIVGRSGDVVESSLNR